ncbi:Pycsar system effector family protein [Streptomyces jumonjinensis]|uniref:Integral membrane plasmid transfer protein n=1 Tax=Streptomyces jumonjinensis TaxID=1945 RepID=A0A646KM61_STRJU|nr:Pycsar system effector family protein [Streptomyces jumonjinensis]MQT03158.1 integral membrane plasmid transfer protein [Streptomyces jumonjinensis]
MTAPYDPDAALTAAVTEIKNEIAQVNVKASLLAALNIGILIGTATITKDIPPHPLTYTLGAAGILTILAATAYTLLAIRPNLGGSSPVGFPAWAGMTADEIRRDLDTDQRASLTAVLAPIAVAKYRALRVTVHLDLLGLGLLAATGGIAPLV